MADLVYNIAKAPVGWVVYLDHVRLGGVYGTKEAAFESAMVRRPSLFEMAKASILACRATRSCAISNQTNSGQRNGTPF
jgi:hypothetical protein